MDIALRRRRVETSEVLGRRIGHPHVNLQFFHDVSVPCSMERIYEKIRESFSLILELHVDAVRKGPRGGGGCERKATVLDAPS